MTALPPKPMTLAEFLEWEEGQPLKHEFDGSRPVAMTGGSYAHARIQRNLSTAIDGRLAGKRCEFFGSDAKIETVFERIGDDWVGHILGADAILRMPEIGIEVPLAEFYRGVDLSAPAEDATAPE